MTHDDVYDETLDRFHDFGPEFRGWLSNHGPMAADAMIRIGHAEFVEHWADVYLTRLEELPAPRWPIDVDNWRDPFGDPSRLGDWIEFFARYLQDASWQETLTVWVPRLMPGAVASATHCLIRTAHAVRALREHTTPQRLAELAHALGYWAARWVPLPPASPQGTRTFRDAFSDLPQLPDIGGARSRLHALQSEPRWSNTVQSLRPVADPAQVPNGLLRLVDAAVTRYRSWAPAEPTMLVHMATAPRAAALLLPSLPETVWPLVYEQAWAASAAIASMYRPRADATDHESATTLASAGDELAAAVATGDAHAIKFAETASESLGRGNPDALPAIHAATTLLA